MGVYFYLSCNLSSEEKIKDQDKSGNNPFLPCWPGLVGVSLAVQEGQGGS